MPTRPNREADDDAAVAEERRLASLATEHLAVPVAVVQAGSGQIAYTNPSWNTLFGYGERDAVGRHISAVHRLGDELPGEHLREMMHRLDRSGWWAGRLASVGADGAHFWSMVTISRITGDVAGDFWVAVYLPTNE
jgi:PAS domain S-box-containing protein